MFDSERDEGNNKRPPCTIRNTILLLREKIHRQEHPRHQLKTVDFFYFEIIDARRL